MDADFIKALILFISAFLEIILVLIFWFKGKSRESFHLGWVALFSAVYCFVHGAFLIFPGNHLLWQRLFWSGILILPPAYIFSFFYTGRTKYLRLKSFIVYFFAILIFVLALFTPLFVKETSLEYPFKPSKGILDPFGRLFCLVVAVIGFYHLFRTYFKDSSSGKWKTKIFMWGVGINFIGALIAATFIPLFFPDFGYTYTYISPMFTVPGIILITYAIFKERLFEVRILFTEILIGIMGAVLLVETILSENLSRGIFSFFVFSVFLVMGYFLIRTTDREVKRTEEAEKLANQLKQLNETLEDRVEKRTRELGRSYKELKERNEELERFYNLTVGRELEMVEMKKELKELKEQLSHFSLDKNK